MTSDENFNAMLDMISQAPTVKAASLILDLGGALTLDSEAHGVFSSQYSTASRSHGWSRLFWQNCWSRSRKRTVLATKRVGVMRKDPDVGLHCTRPKVVAEINIANSLPMLPHPRLSLKL
jgi:hypothetical protein